MSDTLTVEIVANFPNDPVQVGMAFHRDLLKAIQCTKDRLRACYADHCRTAADALVANPALTELDVFHASILNEFAARQERQIGGRIPTSMEQKRRLTRERVRRHRERKRQESA